MQIGKCLFDTFQIGFAETTANVDISCNKRYAMCDGSKPTHENKFNLG